MSRKYANTGEQYYAIQIYDELKDDSPHIDSLARSFANVQSYQTERALGIIKSDDIIEYHLYNPIIHLDKSITMQRGDKLPFSR